MSSTIISTLSSSEGPLFLLMTNTLHPYQVHNIPILSLLPGTTYRFRYEASHFQTSRDEIAKLPGKSGLLVLRDFQTGMLIPLRTFRFFRVEQCGEFIFLELEFLWFVKYDAVKRLFEVRDQDTPERREIAARREVAAKKEREKYSQILSQILQEKGIPNIPNDHLPRLLVPADAKSLESIPLQETSDENNSTTCWSRIVTLLAGLESYRRACFYFLSAVRDLDSGQKARTFASEWRRGIKLYAGRSYSLQVLQLMANGQAPPPPGFVIRLDRLEKHVLSLRSSERVDGAYDRLEFYLSVLPQEHRSTQSVLVLQCDQKLPPPSSGGSEVALPPSFMHLLIKWTKRELFRRRIMPIPVFGAGVSSWFFADALSTSIGYGLKPEYIQLIALFLLAVAVQNWGVFTGALKIPTGTKA